MNRLEPILGTEIVDDIRLGHTWSEYDVLRCFILSENPDWFIEVGVHEGGLSYLLLPEIHYIGYIGIEHNCGIVRPEVKGRYEFHPDAKLICDDCFSKNVADIVGNLDNKIIYCDGGNKVKELKHFKTFCNSGDIIMAHDYHDSNRIIKGIPMKDIHPEVLPMDVFHLDSDDTFRRLPEDIFKNTRIIAFKKE